MPKRQPATASFSTPPAPALPSRPFRHGEELCITV
jgi:hypothetical protein